MASSDPFKEHKLKQLQLCIYLIPVLGAIPALWTVYQGKGDREQKRVCRLSLTLALLWLLIYGSLWAGAAQTSEFLTFRLLYINSLVTSGYFLLSLILMLRVILGKSARLPGVSRLAAVMNFNSEKEQGNK